MIRRTEVADTVVVVEVAQVAGTHRVKKDLKYVEKKNPGTMIFPSNLVNRL